MGNYVCNITCYGLLAPYSALNDNFVRPRIALRPKKYGRPFGNKPTLSIFRPYRCNAASPMALSDSRLWIVIRDITRYLRKIIFFLIYKLQENFVSNLYPFLINEQIRLKMGIFIYIFDINFSSIFLILNSKISKSRLCRKKVNIEYLFRNSSRIY